MKWDVGEVIKNDEDQVLIVDLGRLYGRTDERFEFLGLPPVFPSDGAMIV